MFSATYKPNQREVAMMIMADARCIGAVVPWLRH